MPKLLLAKKIGMTQVFDPAGQVVPVTLAKTGPLVVIREKTADTDGYQSVQVGFGSRREKRIARAQRGEWKGLGAFEAVREIRNLSGKARGDMLGLEQFQEGEVVKVSGISKAKGFQGVMKRHGFHGKDATHGTKHAHREPGSIGGSGGRAGGRVAKGMRMAGRMGGDRVTLKTVTIVRIDPEKQVIALKGAIPGRRGTLLEIRG
ncbi:MAG: 50S ribosomal protein L3 [Candidatus Sungbacteria bacterium RIFCSPLOWO2_01_FULL_60_25]|uniref:50S ribosomal protein L3 n=1 Tax=Candidatus Sungbacteria bacterium RIFCSPLOWO2_01_FULL_60_25 TaxID=1802281 RepID=A0A1G2L9K6_9BACT|nr:MAG: 50S ribosomal protein L3 [Candidatus Sungbacteria bacterium RIFCSPLOWO2_01_FULL_60_25]